MFTRPTAGSETPITDFMYTEPISPNWARYLGWQSTFAPQSMSRKGFFAPGRIGASAGRSMPGMRPMRSMPPASTAPVEPADTTAWARPSRTAIMACTSEELTFLRTASSAMMPPATMASGALSPPMASSAMMYSFIIEPPF